MFHTPCDKQHIWSYEKTQHQLQHDIEAKRLQNNCADILLTSAKNKQKVMTDIIPNLTANQCFNNALPENMFYYNCKCTRNCKCISGRFTYTAHNFNDHICACKYEVSFHGIKYKKIAKKTYQFDVPDPSTSIDPEYCGNIGEITIYHCKCHCGKPRGDTFRLKSL